MPFTRNPRHTVAASLLAALLVADSSCPSVALDGHWQPPGVHPSAASLADVLRRLDQTSGTVVGGSYTASLHIRGGGRTLTVQMRAQGPDVRYDTSVDGAAYASGRVGGMRWRQNATGLVRSIASDLQGDPLDRWPAGILPLDPAHCVVAARVKADILRG